MHSMSWSAGNVLNMRHAQGRLRRGAVREVVPRAGAWSRWAGAGEWAPVIRCVRCGGSGVVGRLLGDRAWGGEAVRGRSGLFGRVGEACRLGSRGLFCLFCRVGRVGLLGLLGLLGSFGLSGLFRFAFQSGSFGAPPALVGLPVGIHPPRYPERDQTQQEQCHRRNRAKKEK